MKTCSQCGASTDTSGRNGTWCKPCSNDYGRQWYQNNKHKARWYAYKKRCREDGLTPVGWEEFEEWLIGCPEQCVVCSSVEKLVIDHCHQTGRLRGWLCSSCNSAEGFLKGDPDRAFSLATYMLSNKEVLDAQAAD